MTLSRFLVTSSPGLAPMLQNELESLGLKAQIEDGGIVSFEGGWLEASRALIGSRLASRVLLSIREFSARNSAMLYDQIRRVEWPKYFATEHTFAVFCHGETADTDYTLSFAPLKIKDAICDEFRKLGFERPNVDRVEPEVRLEAHLHAGRCEISLDLSGVPLHRRGYRLDTTEAPLRETRAAALVMFAGYDGSQSFRDPFCGSGTLAIEAALIAANVAPGTLRAPKDYAVYRLFHAAQADFETAYREFVRKKTEPPHHGIRASDIAASLVHKAKENARRAGVAKFIGFEVADARNILAPDSMIVTNPPYGERLGSLHESAELIQAFARQAKHHCPGSTLSFILPRGELEKSIGFKPKRKLAIENGPIPSVFLHFELYAGSRKKS